DAPKWKRYVPHAAGAIAVIVVLGFAYNFTMGGQDTEEYNEVTSTASLVKLTTVDLCKRFIEAPTESNEKYKNEVIEVAGLVIEVKKEDDRACVVLQDPGTEGTVECVFYKPHNPANDPAKDAVKGKRVQIKGICQGREVDSIKLIGCRMIGIVPPGKK